ncbi:hypothetical protein L21SP2_0615 [Salinispira pacifica]|uniref:Uncharacterized protein n=1 Tax=Salinispira pacifica TaxID=1307761 RepID=V5WET5_9SPIO|nr:hypothetical protein L21SP2_0615 [Salinispira pacifica]
MGKIIPQARPEVLRGPPRPYLLLLCVLLPGPATDFTSIGGFRRVSGCSDLMRPFRSSFF